MKTVGVNDMSASNVLQSEVVGDRTTMKEKFGSILDGKLVPKIILERIDIKKEYIISSEKNVAEATDTSHNFVPVFVKEEFVAGENATKENTSNPTSQIAYQVSQTSISSISAVDSGELNYSTSDSLDCKTKEIEDPKNVTFKLFDDHFEGASRVKEEKENQFEESLDELENDISDESENQLDCVVKGENADEFEAFFRKHLKKVEIGRNGENDKNENQFVFIKTDEPVGLKSEELIFDDCSLTESEICANDFDVAQCLAESSRRNSLRRNSKPRTYNYPYTCDQCSDKFRFLKDFNQHMKKHKYGLARAPLVEIEGNDENEDQFIIPTYQELVGLKTEEPSFEEFSLAESEICANDATVALCTVQSSRRSVLRNKLKQRTYNFPYACDQCSNKFRFLKDLNQHSKDHRKKVSRLSLEINANDENGKIFDQESQKKNFDKFSSTVSEICAYADAAQCLAESIRKSVLRKKLKLRTYKYACDRCPNKFRSLEELSQHSKKHNDDVSHADCGAVDENVQNRNRPTFLKNGPPSSLRKAKQKFDESVSNRRSFLRKKLKQGTYNYPYACDQCPGKFRFLKDLNQHSREHNRNKSSGTNRISKNQFLSSKSELVGLESEKQSFENISSTVSEIFAHNASVAKFFVESDRRSVLRKQFKARTYNYPYACDQCPDKFRFLKDLNRHSKEHRYDFSRPSRTNIDENEFSFSTNGKGVIPKKEEPNVNELSSTVSNHASAESNFRSVLRKKFKPRTYNYPYVCDLCPDKFRFLKHFHLHLKEHKGNVPRVSGLTELKSEQMSIDTEQKSYCCTECPLKFRTFRGLRRHTYVHKDKDSNEDSKLNTEKRGKRMKVSPSEGGIYSCDRCPLKSKYKSVLIRHLEMHAENCTYTCKVCHRQFRHHRSYQRHAMVHSDEKPFVCPHCPVKLKQFRSYRNHLRKHSAKEPVYSRSNGVSDILKDPFKFLPGKQRDRTQNPSKRPFACKFCASRFTQNADLRRHIADVHGSDFEYQCQVCPRVFFHLSSLKRHLQSHLDTDLYKCEICLAAFNEKRLLKSHLLIHFSGKWFMCAHCFIKFKQKSQLQEHLASGCSNKPLRLKSVTSRQCNVKGFMGIRNRYFSCAHCPAKFSSKSSLQKHLLTYSHTNVKQHTCVHCPKKFWTRRMLKHHLQTHVMETPPDKEIIIKTDENAVVDVEV